MASKSTIGGNVITITEGEKVAANGVYDIPIEAYHGDICIGPSVSSSGLRAIENQSPAHYFAGSYLNPNREPPEDRPAFDFGRAAHTLLLGEKDFKHKYAIRPERWADWRTSAAKEWRDEMRGLGRSILTPEDVTAIRRFADNLAADPLIRSGLMQGEIERSIIYQDAATGVWVKTRPDIIPAADGVVVDLKTTTCASPDAIQRTVKDMGYAQQGALIASAMRTVLNVEMTDFVLVWVEKKPPYAVNISPVDMEWIGWAERQNRRALNRFAECIAAGEWPAYPREKTTFMPPWLRKSFEEQDKLGLFAPETDDRETAR